MISVNLKYFCSSFTKIENYEQAVNDTAQTWDCHHRLETHNSDGERRLVDISAEELKALDMYYNRPASELIFLTRKDHQGLHLTGKKLSEDIRKRMSKASKGKPKSEEMKRKLSETRKGMTFSEEHKKNLSRSHLGKHWKPVDGKRVFF